MTSSVPNSVALGPETDNVSKRVIPDTFNANVLTDEEFKCFALIDVFTSIVLTFIFGNRLTTLFKILMLGPLVKTVACAVNTLLDKLSPVPILILDVVRLFALIVEQDKVVNDPLIALIFPVK